MRWRCVTIVTIRHHTKAERPFDDRSAIADSVAGDLHGVDPGARHEVVERGGDLPGAVREEEPDRVTAARFIIKLFGRRSHPQVSGLMGDLLDVPGGHFEQGVSQLGQGPGGGQLVTDIRHVAVNRVEPRLPDADQPIAVLRPEPGDGPGTAIVFIDLDVNGPVLDLVHVPLLDRDAACQE
jgi:hypothetical protein